MKSFFNVFLLLLSVAIYSQNGSVHFTLKPTLTPDAKDVIFSYEGDLWKVSSNGGDAHRLTAMQGVETNPSVSPDGNGWHFLVISMEIMMCISCL